MWRSATASRSERATPRNSRPKATLRSTVAQGISAKSWNTKARSGPGPVTGRPSTRTSPAVGDLKSDSEGAGDHLFNATKSATITARGVGRTVVLGRSEEYTSDLKSL